MNLHEAFPNIPETVGNYRKLASRLGEVPQEGNSRVCHLNYIRQFLRFEHLVIDGKRKHAITIHEILKPTYVQWVPIGTQRPHDATLIIGHHLAQTKLGLAPGKMAQDIGKLVVTTAELMQLLALGTRKAGLWRKGALPIDVEEDEQLHQYKRYHKYIGNVLQAVITSQIFLRQFVTNRWWTLQESSAGADALWRLSTQEEQDVIEEIKEALLAEMKLQGLAHVFLLRREEEFYSELLTRVQAQYKGVQMVWRTWWFEPLSPTDTLSNEDLETLRLGLAAGIGEWADSSGIDKEIIDLAIAPRSV